ncbi:uncharacterized protein LOC108625981 [Ceratina calcarata]|uniref:Uncharacterized protein LOC108625981 n=1 Tax=Ceratina calcarata TaxID=156304 RepID=A0AAJ7N8A1_9HYME|nr:uncharacterized protein LOC108625981 [Ceratina calcarata]
MGDIRVLDPRMDPRLDMKQPRPWPPMYRSHPARGPSFCYRPMPLEAMAQWMAPHMPDYNYVPARMSANSNKGRDYYYLAPLYRNAMPPPQAMSPLQVPPVAVSPRMMIMEPRSRTKSSGGHCRSSAPPCTCSMGRTRSLEDVRSEISEWEDFHDENGNHLQGKSSKNGVSRQTRRSMENLLDVETAEQHELNTFERVGRNCRKVEDRRNEKPGRRRGSYMVCRLLYILL